MAPKKKPSPASSSGTKPRRSPRLSGDGSTLELMELPKRKKAKTTPIKSDAEEEKKPVSPVKKEESADENEKKEQSSDEEEKPVKEQSADEEEKKEQSADEEEKPVSADVEEKDDAKKRIVIEHCKSCNSFKTRAAQVKKALEEGVEGIEVVVNPEKPRKGCFEIREDGDGEVFVSLLDMKRPFKRMKDLNMEELIAEIVQKVKNDD